jgi:hypothetical protein
MKKLYFCLIPYFVTYDGTEAPNIPECANFLPVDLTGEDGTVYELLFGALTAKKALPRAIADEAGREGFVSDATVVFCAKAETGALVTVGWYSHANVTPHPEVIPMTNEEGEEIQHPFFFCTHRENAVLLPEDERFKPQWQIPRSKNSAKFGFSADPFLSADTPSADAFCRAFMENIAHYEANGDNWLCETEDEETQG